jgi:hypothetical protein
VRRRRIARHSVETVSGVAAVGVLAWAATTLPHVRHDPPPAVPTPTTTTPGPSVPPASPVPTPAPTPAPTPVVEPGRPPYLPAPDGLLAETGPGWVLSTYQDRDTEENPVGAQDVFLTSPRAATYRVLRLDPTVPDVVVQSWSAGSSQAVVVVDDEGGHWRGTLDLTTGEVVRGTLRGSGALRLLGTRADGTELWGASSDEQEVWSHASDGTEHLLASTDAELGAVDPSGQRVLTLPEAGGGAENTVAVLDLSSGRTTSLVASPSTTTACHPDGWLDAANVVAHCVEPVDASAAEVVVVPVDGGAPRAAGDEVPFVPAHLVTAVDGPEAATTQSGTRQCTDALYAWRDGVPRRVAELSTDAPQDAGSFDELLAAQDGSVYVGLTSCESYEALGPIERVSPDEGDPTTLIPGTGARTSVARSVVVGR